MQRSAQMLQQQNGTYLSRRLRVRHERREERRGGGEATSKSVFGNHFRRYFFMSALARFSPSVVWFSLENSASRTLAAHLLCILHPNALARCWS